MISHLVADFTDIPCDPDTLLEMRDRQLRWRAKPEKVLMTQEHVRLLQMDTFFGVPVKVLR